MKQMLSKASEYRWYHIRVWRVSRDKLGLGPTLTSIWQSDESRNMEEVCENKKLYKYDKRQNIIKQEV